MIYVVLSDGTFEELPDDTQILTNNGALLCFDPVGRLVKHYERDAVKMYGQDDKVKAIIEKLKALQ